MPWPLRSIRSIWTAVLCLEKKSGREKNLHWSRIPLSEPETAQLEGLVQALIPDQRGPLLTDPAPPDTTGIFISLHSFGELVLWPWGNTTAPAPNYDGLKAIGDKMATYNNYLSCQPSICLYFATGTSDDWSYGELGIPSYTFEVGDQFMPPYAEIDAEQWPGNGLALQYAAKIARAPYQLAFGPDALAITTPLTVTNALTVTATINDQDNGNRPLLQAEAYIDSPPWEADATALPLTAVDGAFDNSVETVTAVLDTSGLATGQHMLFVRGQDDQGHWGPVSATFFHVAAVAYSPANSTASKAVSAAQVAPGEVLSYTLRHALALTGTHSYTLSLVDELAEEMTVQPASIRLNGLPAPELYDAIGHAIRYANSDLFTDTTVFTLTFQVQVNGAVTMTTLANDFQVTGTVDDQPLLPTVSNTTVTQVVPFRNYLPFVYRE